MIMWSEEEKKEKGGGGGGWGGKDTEEKKLEILNTPSEGTRISRPPAMKNEVQCSTSRKVCPSAALFSVASHMGV